MDISVSIIVPVFNAESYLPGCLNSILNQTLEDFEVILINDGSTDASGSICEDYAGMDTRIKTIHQNNQGLVNARKAGLSAARGAYVGFVDSDDWIEPDMFLTLFQAAVDFDADIVAEGIIEDVSGICKCQKNALKEGIYQSAEERRYVYRNMMNCEEYFNLGIQPYLVNKLIRRELAGLHIPTIEASIRIGEDAAAVYPMLLLSERIVLMGTCHYHYCLREGSMMWNRADADTEFRGVAILHRYLESRLKIYGGSEYLKGGLWRYTINNLLVRTFSRYADMKEDTVLFPFQGITKNDEVIIYGAGALGRALYQYVAASRCVNIRAWVDKSAETYQKLGLPVDAAGGLRADKGDKVLVAVFNKRTAAEIVKALIGIGIAEEQIRCVEITAEQEDTMMRDIQIHCLCSKEGL